MHKSSANMNWARKKLSQYVPNVQFLPFVRSICLKNVKIGYNTPSGPDKPDYGVS